MAEFTDDYFLNLTMKYDERIDDIYCRWAVWCAKSNDKYYIDGKDGHFFTHVRTDEEIAEERRKRYIMEMIMRERIENEIDGNEEKEESFRIYEEYLHNIINGNIKRAPKPYKVWLEKCETEEQ